MNTIKKILLGIIIAIGILGFGKVYADFELFEGEAQYDYLGFWPQSLSGQSGLFWCMHSFTQSKADMPRGYTPGETRGDYYEHNGYTPPPWKGYKRSNKYTQYRQLDMQLNQDAAYVLAEAHNGEAGLFEARGALWRLDINLGETVLGNDAIYAVENEARAYRSFYEYIHSSVPDKTGYGDAQDKFNSLITDNTDYSNIHNMVNRDEDYYIVGPFNISWPDGRAPDGINQFSWISNITALDQNNNAIANIQNRSLQIIDKNENLIYDSDRYGNMLNVPKINQDFYIKFHSTEALDVSLKFDFGYLESCPTLAYQYNGRFYHWSWSREDVDVHEKWGIDEDGDRYLIHRCDIYQYVLEKKAAGSSQTLLNSIYAYKRYKSTSKTIPFNNKVDLTMDIEGRVFLDNDQGKANEGNDKYDNGEELEGIDVWLYDSNNNFIGITLTNRSGHYSFTRLNAQKEYYVRFVYNGMLYTNVRYIENGANNSKATELAQGHPNNRIDFNNQYKEVASYPQNYHTKDCITGANITNKVYEQGDLVTLYKDVAKAMVASGGNERAAYQSVINAHSNESEIREKVQYIADCRISAYTVTNYARFPIFIVEDRPYTVGRITYTPIYEEQRYVNLGIKGRPTFDLALYKDAVKADVVINEKTETYIYDERKANGNPFTIGVSEPDYLNSVRESYLRTKNYDNPSTRALEQDYYDLDLRAEEVANNQVTEYIKDGRPKIDTDKYNVVGTNEYENYDSMKWADDNNHNIVNENRMKIFVKYRLSVRNQSGVIGAITEVVDYFDTNFRFVSAYEGDIEGNKIADVNKFDNSMYGTATEYKNNSKYTTIYLRPARENRLTNNNKEQYIYVTLQLLGNSAQNDAGDFLKGSLLNDGTVAVLNVAEINGYKTYDATTGTATPGLVDIDSNPGNFNISNITSLTDENIKKYSSIYEDDTSRAPASIYRLMQSRTLEGTVFEDATGKDKDKIYTGEERKGNGKLDKGEKGIKDVIVQLVEIKNNQMVVRAQTRTDDKGWYGFTGFIPGNYTIRYIYGSDDQTAMNKKSWVAGSNDISYNGQDYQSTIFTSTEGGTLSDQAYKTDGIDRTNRINDFTYINSLYKRYKNNYDNKAQDESTVNVLNNTTIRKYQDGFYWYTQDNSLSDAQDDEYRRQLVINYSKNEYDTEIANYKADVFNSYYPKSEQPSYIQSNQQYWRQLANELERRTYRYAYTPVITVEVEYAKTTDTGNKKNKNEDYKHTITGVDFGIVERPKAKLELTKNVSHIKVTATDGTVLFDTDKKTTNLAWTVKTDRYKEPDPILITMDDELINGATVELTYKFTVTNNSELGEDGNSIIAAKNIIDYIDNNIIFNVEDNRGMWEVVTTKSVQNATKSTLINNMQETNTKKIIDLTTRQTIIKTTQDNPLTKNLGVGETTEGTLVLRKVLATESAMQQLTYKNIAEIVEVKQIVGRHDHTSVPGNQDPEEEPTNDDTYKAEIVKILPPFGVESITIYFVIGIVSLTILAGGIFLIKKYVIEK